MDIGSRSWLDGFNPRAREGRDTYTVAEAAVDEVSIHAPVKGAI